MTVASYRLCSVEADFTAAAGSKLQLSSRQLKVQGGGPILNKSKPITPPITHVTYANLSRCHEMIYQKVTRGLVEMNTRIQAQKRNRT